MHPSLSDRSACFYLFVLLPSSSCLHVHMFFISSYARWWNLTLSHTDFPFKFTYFLMTICITALSPTDSVFTIAYLRAQFSYNLLTIWHSLTRAEYYGHFFFFLLTQQVSNVCHMCDSVIICQNYIHFIYLIWHAKYQPGFHAFASMYTHRFCINKSNMASTPNTSTLCRNRTEAGAGRNQTVPLILILSLIKTRIY